MLGQVGLDLVEPFRHEPLEPMLGEVVFQAIRPGILHSLRLSERRRTRVMGRSAYFACPLVLTRSPHDSRAVTVLENANSSRGGRASRANQPISSSSSFSEGSPDAIRPVQ